MAFHVDEKRDLDMRIGDVQIDVAPGMYDILDVKQKKSFNVQEVPFGARAQRKIFEVNPDQVNEPNGDPLWDYINIVREEKFKYFKTRLLHKGRAFDYRTGREPESHPNSKAGKAAKKKNKSNKHSKLQLSISAIDIEGKNANLGPGTYYKDPVATKLQKIKQ